MARMELVPCPHCCATGMREQEQEQCFEFKHAGGLRFWRCQLAARHEGECEFPDAAAPKRLIMEH